MDAALWPSVLGKLIGGEDLSADEATTAMSAILQGKATPAQIAGFVVALRVKGETAAEIAALVRTMLAFAEHVEVDGPLVDTCGTGGDCSGTINVSTIAAFVVAGAGARVAKHGNRGLSSPCGSADLLEELGVVVDLGPAGVARCIEEAGIGFCFAPRFHPAMRHAGPTRRELGVPTVFNFLGPLANPAGARRQVVGVGDPSMAELMIRALVQLGCERAFVFHGHDGLDELTTTTTSAVWELQAGEVTSYVVDPEDLGIPRSLPADLVGAGRDRNAEITRDLLGGKTGPARDIVVLNAAAALVAAGVCDGLVDGIAEASGSLESGRAAECLERLVATSQAARAEEAQG